MKYLINFLVAIDQLGNTLAGGNPDNTISARVGYYTEKYYQPKAVPFQWTFFKNVINLTFWPVDGKDHCKEAYYNDVGELFDERTSDFAVAILAIFIILSCIPIGILLYTLYALRIVCPKRINRTQNIKNRLSMTLAKLKGVNTELNQFKIKVDQELDNLVDQTEKSIQTIEEKIDAMLNLKNRLVDFKNNKEKENSKNDVELDDTKNTDNKNEVKKDNPKPELKKDDDNPNKNNNENDSTNPNKEH